jgi:hypothetical protein
MHSVFIAMLLQEFVIRWTQKESKRPHHLTPGDIAALIVAGRVSLGESEDVSVSTTDPELIGKAIGHFRSHPSNAWFVQNAIPTYVEKRCQAVQQAPFLLGIEI